MVSNLRHLHSVANEILGFATGTRRELRGWWWILPLAWLGAPSRLSASGIGGLRGKELLLSLRCGARVLCRLDEVFTIVEVFGLRQYEAAALPSRESQSVIVDVGANIGVATVWLAWRFPEAQIVAIEPGREALRRLMYNITVNGLDSRVKVIHGGVGAQDGVVASLERGTTSSVNRLVASTGAEIGERVDVLSLRSVAAVAGGYIDLLKIDCEGAEYAFFHGDLSPTPSLIGMIVGEYHRGHSREHDELMESLALSGYDLQSKVSDGPYGTFVARVGS